MPCYYPQNAYKTPAGDVTFVRKNAISNIKLPCGQCLGCRLRHSTTWATRIMNEIQTTENNQATFLTLTYNDRNLPNDHSLNKEHFKDFIKRFRRCIHPTKIRYYMCGEYGDQTMRPHYHAIIFGYDFTQSESYQGILHQPRQRFQAEETENPYYMSSLLTELWTKGNHIIAKCNYETAAYVARYCIKKVNGEKAIAHYFKTIIDMNPFTGEIFNYQEVQLEPEYSTMSRGKNKPSGIGSEWYKQYKTDCFPSNYLINNGMKIPVPNYYAQILKQEDPKQYEDLKIQKQRNIKQYSILQLASMHTCKLAQNQTLGRNKI